MTIGDKGQKACSNRIPNDPDLSTSVFVIGREDSKNWDVRKKVFST